MCKQAREHRLAAFALLPEPDQIVLNVGNLQFRPQHILLARFARLVAGIGHVPDLREQFLFFFGDGNRLLNKIQFVVGPLDPLDDGEFRRREFSPHHIGFGFRSRSPPIQLAEPG